MHKKTERAFFLSPLSFIICAFLAAVTILGAVVLAVQSPENRIVIVVFAVVVYVALCAFVIQLIEILRKKSDVKRPSGPVLGSIMYDTVNFSDEPALICDEFGKIIWFNKAAQTASGSSSSILGSKLGNILSSQVNDITVDDKRHEFHTILGGKNYTIQRTKIRSGDKIYFLLMFRDVTELVNLKQFVKNDEKIVSYIIVDNLEELLQFEQERYREAAAKIEALIREWASSCGGTVKEYEGDKYLFIL